MLLYPETLPYFVGFRNVTANSGGGVDAAKLYDSTGNDTFTSTTTASFSGTSFNYTANGYTKIYAYLTKGNDTATPSGTAGNDRVSGNAAFVILSSGAFLQQVLNFSTVIVNASTGTDSVTLDDDTGNDTYNATGNTTELVYAKSHKIRLLDFDSVTANGNKGGVNKKSVTNPLAYQLRFVGNWV
jgi:hypothetical protein